MSLQRSALPLLILLVAMPYSAARAECPLREFVLSGSVSAGNAPEADVRIAVEWNEKQAGIVTVERDSDADGQFNVPVQYSAFNGRSVLGKERCDFNLESLSVKASKRGVGKAEREVRIKDGDQTELVALDLR